MGMVRSPKRLLLLLIPIVLAIFFSLGLQSTLLQNQAYYKAWLESFGQWYLLIYAIVQILGIIVAPFGGFFIQIGLFALLPPIQAVLLIYAVTTPAFFINYYLARKYGRQIIKKIIGAHALDTVDNYAQDIGPQMLLLLKIFQGGVFDYVSYAAGVTGIRPIVFFLVNVFGGAPGIAFSYLLLTNVENFTFAIISLMATGYILFGLSVLLIYLKRRNQKSEKPITFP